MSPGSLLLRREPAVKWLELRFVHLGPLIYDTTSLYPGEQNSSTVGFLGWLRASCNCCEASISYGPSRCEVLPLGLLFLLTCKTCLAPVYARK